MNEITVLDLLEAYRALPRDQQIIYLLGLLQETEDNQADEPDPPDSFYAMQG